MLLVDNAKAVQHLVLECLNDTFDERFSIRRLDRRFLDRTAIACEFVVERSSDLIRMHLRNGVL